MVRNLSSLDLDSVKQYLLGGKVMNNKITFCEGAVSVPSNLFPLTSNKIAIYYHENTHDIEDCNIDPNEVAILKEAFNEVEVGIGRCYTNINSLIEKAREKGLRGKLKSYVGWLSINKSIHLVHHCWAVYGNRILLDFGAMWSDYELQNREDVNSLSIDDMRKLMVENHHATKDDANTDKFVFGKCMDTFFYIGCECDASRGRERFIELMKDVPYHPCYRNNNVDGSSKMQKMIMDSERGI